MSRASSEALVFDGPQVLLVRRGPTAPWAPNLWGLPGGHVEPGETPAAAIVRELAEEVGIDWPYHLAHLAHLGPRRHLFVVRRPGAYPFHVTLRDGEHTAFVWCRPLVVLNGPLPLAPGVALALSLSLDLTRPRSAHRGA